MGWGGVMQTDSGESALYCHPELVFAEFRRLGRSACDGGTSVASSVAAKRHSNKSPLSLDVHKLFVSVKP